MRNFNLDAEEKNLNLLPSLHVPHYGLLFDFLQSIKMKYFLFYFAIYKVLCCAPGAKQGVVTLPAGRLPTVTTDFYFLRVLCRTTPTSLMPQSARAVRISIQVHFTLPEHTNTPDITTSRLAHCITAFPLDIMTTLNVLLLLLSKVFALNLKKSIKM